MFNCKKSFLCDYNCTTYLPLDMSDSGMPSQLLKRRQKVRSTFGIICKWIPGIISRDFNKIRNLDTS